MRQAEASAAPAARAPAKLLVRKAATPRGWTRCPGHPEDGPPGRAHAGTPSSPGFGQGPPGPRPAVPRLGGHLAMSRYFREPSAPRRVPSSPNLVPLSCLRPANSSPLRQAGAAPGAACAIPRTTCPAPSGAVKHRHLLLPAEAFEAEILDTLFPTKRLGPKRKREPGEYSPVPVPIHQPAPSGSEPE